MISPLAFRGELASSERIQARNKIFKCLVAMGMIVASLVPLLGCGPCSQSAGLFQFESIVLWIAVFLSVFMTVSAILDLRQIEPTKWHESIRTLASISNAIMALLFPVTLAIGAAWNAPPCPACMVFWGCVGLLATMDPLLGRFPSWVSSGQLACRHTCRSDAPFNGFYST